MLCAFPQRVVAQMVIIPQERVQEAANPSTIAHSVLHFEGGERVSFGTIGEDCGKWQTTLRWSSSQSVTISRITTSCGCLLADWSRRESTNATDGTIEITYHPKGHAGEVEQKIFIYTSLSNDKPTAIVRVVGRVEASADRSSLYPHRAGTLGLRSKSVRLSARERTMEIAVMNCGSVPLSVTHDKRLSIGGVVAYTKPAVLEVGKEGVLVVEMEPDGTPPMLYLAGVNAPPRERKIEIEFEKQIK